MLREGGRGRGERERGKGGKGKGGRGRGKGVGEGGRGKGASLHSPDIHSPPPPPFNPDILSYANTNFLSEAMLLLHLKP